MMVLLFSFRIAKVVHCVISDKVSTEANRFYTVRGVAAQLLGAQT